jgi:hypothetical protein
MLDVLLLVGFHCGAVINAVHGGLYKQLCNAQNDCKQLLFPLCSSRMATCV